MSEILIVDDEPQIRRALVINLRARGYEVDQAASGEEALSRAAARVPDAVILDLGLPGLAGLEVLRRLRGRNSKVPVLILTAADSVEQRVKGLDLGADDYMAKPFALSELEARVRALMRRSLAGAQAVLRNGPLALDPAGRVATLNEQPLELSARELGLLEILISRPGRLVSKEQLVDHLCEWGEEVSTNAIEVYVHRLRKKIEPGGIRVVTVRGLGYSMQRVADPGEGATGGPAASAA